MSDNATVAGQNDRFRAAALASALDNASADGSTLSITGAGVNDLFVDEDQAIRPILPVLSAWAALRNMPTLVYSLAGGIRALDAPQGPTGLVPSGIDAGTPTTIALDIVFDAMMRGQAPSLMAVDYADAILAEEAGGLASTDTARILEQLAERAFSPRWVGAGHRLVLIGRTGLIDSRLTRIPGVNTVHLGLPRLAERRVALEKMTASPKGHLHLADGLDLDRAARISGGLTLDELSRLRKQSCLESPVTVQRIVDAKKEAIRRLAGESLLIHDEFLDLDADVAGLCQVLLAVREEERRGNMSLRFILSGPPGVGKTWISTAIAAFMGVPALELGRIKGRYVGESEDNLNRALAAIEACAPALLIIDEAEAAGLGRRGETTGSEGSEVTASLRASLFTWLGDVGDRLGISVLALTNMPQLLDPASTDRFTILPVLHPTAREAAQIMAIQARREGLSFDAEGALRALSGSAEAFSGRQAVRLLGSAQVHAQQQGRDTVEESDVAAAVTDSMTRIGPEEERQSLMAVAATSWARHLPWNAAKEAGETDREIPGYLVPFVRTDGTVDLVALKDRINVLGRRP